MKVVLGSVLALLLAGAAPALAGDNGAPQGGYEDSTDMNAQQDQGAQADTQRQRHHARHGQHAGQHQGRTFAQGDRVRSRFLERHKLTNYSRFRLEAPNGGDQWVKARGQFLLVNSDGVVKQAVARHRRHAAGQHRGHRQRMQQEQQQQQGGYDDQSQDQSYPDDQSQ